MELAGEDGSIKLRSYQQEMLEMASKGNIIVAMDTGSGKTHVAIARIRRELEGSNAAKLSWFITPSVALSMQQHTALTRNLPAYRIITLTGLDNVDKWTDQETWDAALENVNVVVGTPAVLLDALTHGFVQISEIALLVFDEAHHATKAHPMASIMKTFYHPALQRQQQVPAILGLTASPIMNSKQGSLEMLEATLNALSVTPKQHRTELLQHVSAPEFITVSYSTDGSAASDEICSALAKEARSYDIDTDPYVVELQRRNDPRSEKELASLKASRKTFCCEQLRALDLRAVTLEKELGPSMASWYISRCISRFREGLSSSHAILPDLSEHERSHLAEIFRRIDHGRTFTGVQGALSITDKAQKLAQVLQRYASPSLRGIIFVEQRAQVTALSELLQRLPEVQKAYKIASFVGTSASAKRKASVADLVDTRDQQTDLDAFRSGDKNLMICTSVLEEGIDVSSCNLVICFQLPSNLVSFVQRRGRARKSDSKYVHFVLNDEDKKQSKPWEALEAQMRQQYMDDTRKIPETTDDEIHMANKLYRIDGTGAVLTMENAKSHLYHFCSAGTIDASNYIDLRPEFDFTQDPASKLWTATVDLPSFVHTDLRHATSSQSWKSADLAVKDAAFEVYVALHKIGLVNDNLLPLTKDHLPENGQHLDQPSIIDVSERKLWPAVPREEIDSNSLWYSATVNINCGGETIVDMIMWTPSMLPKLGDFMLYWNREVTYTIRLQSSTISGIDMAPRQMELMRASTKLLLRSVHATRMSMGAEDFPVLFTPAGETDLGKWLQKVRGLQTASDFFAKSSGHDGAGLIRVSSQTGRNFFLDVKKGDGVFDAVSNEVQVLTFPKRKDFLHPIPPNSSTRLAYTTTQLFPLGECTIDRLPAKYAIFAAFIPSIMHRIDTALLAADLNSSILKDVQVSDASLVLEAISAPAASEPSDYNRLEYLGDTCLKHCVELQVMAQHLNWPESYLTAERDRMVRNTNLAKAALNLGLDKYILTKPFTGSKWRPLYVSEILAAEMGQRQMSTKTLADVVEALIGAAFVDGGVEKALVCMRVLLPTETWHHPRQCFDALLGELRPSEMTNLTLHEQVIGHRFTHPTLLVEAITHVSLESNRTSLSLERLEFLGDSVLDMLVTPKLFAHSRNLRHDQLHGIHKALVNAAFLGHLCMSYEVDEDTHRVQQSSRKLHLYDLLRCGAQLVPLRLKSLAAFNELRQEIDEALASSNEYPWPALVAERPQKFFCDLVESLLGAIFVDTRGDLSVCEAFAAKLGIFKHMNRILDDHVDTLSPKERMGIIADREAVQYENIRSQEEGRKLFTCTVKVGEESVATVMDCGSEEEAEVRAAYKACKIMQARGAPNDGVRKRKVDVAGLRYDDAMEIGEPSNGGAVEWG